MNIFNANGSINKNLVKFAKALNLEIWLHDDGLFTVSELDEDGEAACEWMYSYQVNNGELFFNGNIYFPKEAKEELPHWITTGEKVKELLVFTASVVNEK